MFTSYQTQNNTQTGYMVVLVLVFSAVFVTILFGLTGFVFVQNQASIGKEQKEQAVQIAEAGLDYYRWYLAHNPEDLTDGTGQPGPYEHTYADPEGGQAGTFSLEIDGNEQCGSITAIDIESTGWTVENPDVKRTVRGKYARPSVAEYAYIINDNVWAGADRTIKGKYHSNGGIRMDGDNESTVTSAVEDWYCTESFGCDQPQTQAGVFGSGSGSNLWEYPVESVDFVGITQDLANMKTQAQDQGLYFHPVGGQSNQHGYRAVFQGNGTVDVYRVRRTDYNWGYTTQNGWERDYDRITRESFLGNYDIPANCSLLFFEDKLWVEGTISGKVTVAAANIQQPVYNTDIVVNGDITYADTDGSDGLTAIAERSVRIPLYSPNNLELNGVLIAQQGRFGRNHYTSGYPSYGGSYATRDQLTMHGSIVSNGRVGTRWTCNGSYCSGYANRDNTYDRQLAVDPPPLTPYVDDEYQFVEWQEVE